MKLSNNLTIEQRMNTKWGDKFYPEQRAEILDGARLGINAELYANPAYDHGIMKEIKIGLSRDPSLANYVDSYVHRKNTHMGTRDITLCVEKNVDVDVMLQLVCCQDVFRIIRVMMFENYDFSQCENTNDVMRTFDEYVEIAPNRFNRLLKQYIDMLRIKQAKEL